MAQPSPGSTVEIIVQWSTGTSEDLSRAPAEGVDHDVADVATAIEPLHPGTSDPELARYAVIRIPRSEADRVLARLMSNPAVDAAYIKPTGEAP